jgi:hypothetical protein
MLRAGLALRRASRGPPSPARSPAAHIDVEGRKVLRDRAPDGDDVCLLLGTEAGGPAVRVVRRGDNAGPVVSVPARASGGVAVKVQEDLAGGGGPAAGRRWELSERRRPGAGACRGQAWRGAGGASFCSAAGAGCLQWAMQPVAPHLCSSGRPATLVLKLEAGGSTWSARSSSCCRVRPGCQCCRVWCRCCSRCRCSPRASRSSWRVAAAGCPAAPRTDLLHVYTRAREARSTPRSASRLSSSISCAAVRCWPLGTAGICWAGDGAEPPPPPPSPSSSMASSPYATRLEGGVLPPRAQPNATARTSSSAVGELALQPIAPAALLRGMPAVALSARRPQELQCRRRDAAAVGRC